MDVCNVMFEQLKKMIMQQRHKYFPYDPQNLVSVVTGKVITSNTRRNMRAVMSTNVAFATMSQDNSECLLNKSARLIRELVAMKKQVKHLAVENQPLSSQNSNIAKWQSTMLDELGAMDDTMTQLYDEMILIQQVVAPLIGIQNNAQEVVKLLKIANRAIDQMQEWIVEYPYASQHLEKRDKISTKIDKV